ncbi:hypothetical protein BT93_L1541 [Corymbia citriodora subsp. variegata]|uniref:Uncharacterized protein n=1 Tax=Corymbia citriodora subsp. variegata TaxID=360336 RepID=A0A8T0CMK8_CORYI|nr:hypothetical protein BT93_L1541 [Corymbia citriodora subsp. variegata]
MVSVIQICIKYHTCTATLSGDLYTWGGGGGGCDGAYSFGVPGHGDEVSHRVRKIMNGILEEAYHEPN